MNKKVLILGVTGQIGQYLSKRLLEQEYEVYGVSRTRNGVDLDARINYIQLDFNDYPGIDKIIRDINPSEIYNLVSPTNINDTINNPETAYHININCLTHLCELIKSIGSEAKLFNASSVEMYRGNLSEDKLEFTFDDNCVDFYPVSPYGISKVSAYWLIRYYREVWHLPFYTGVLCNVASPKLNESYILPKIIKHVKYHVDDVLNIGNIDIGKDFSHASDVVDGIIFAVQSLTPRDYVIASGQSHTLRNLIEYSYQEQQITIQWEGDEGYDSVSQRLLVTSDPKLQRKYEKRGERMYGHSRLLKNEGWQPKYNIKSLIHEMYVII